MISEGARLLDIVAKFMGLETVASVWYCSVGLFLFFVVFKIQIKIMRDNIRIERKLELFDQRQEFQSEFMAMQEDRFNKVSESVISNSENSAIVKLLLIRKNIKIKS